jgi:AraC family transcriptional regulator, transcriptional activator FtrA
MRKKMTKLIAASEIAPRPSAVALVYDGLCTFEYGIVAEVFGLDRPELGGALYQFSSVCLEKGPVRAAGGLRVKASGTPADLDNADIIIIPGWRGKDEAVPHAMCRKLQEADHRGARFLSICSGIYVLAAAGLLTGKRATTHWRYIDDFRSKYDDVEIDGNAIYIEADNIVTSAGSSAGIDACLHIVRKDYGTKIANSVARRLVMHSHRQGGQTQFVEQPVPKHIGSRGLSAFLDTLRATLNESHDIQSMAKQVGQSERTFQRRFLATTGLPAIQWLIQERVSQSRLLLESTDLSVLQISENVGFASEETLRYHFRRSLGVTPLEYRKRFSVKAAPVDLP